MIGLVIESGVGFDNSSVSTDRPHAAMPLVEFIDTVPNIVNEAHSTDDQTAESLSKLVRDQFTILKFSPALTYSVRRAFFALSQIEADFVPACSRADLPSTCEKVMLHNPVHWRSYCTVGGLKGRVARRFGYSDRIHNYRASRQSPQRSSG